VLTENKGVTLVATNGSFALDVTTDKAQTTTTTTTTITILVTTTFMILAIIVLVILTVKHKMGANRLKKGQQETHAG